MSDSVDRQGRADADRAEQALARAFAEHAVDHDFAPLDPAALQRRGPAASSPRTGGAAAEDRPGRGVGRRFGLGLVAASVVVVLAVPAGVALVGPMFNAGNSAPAGAPAQARDEAISDAADGSAEVAEADVLDTLPPPASGWRWVVASDAAVQVPEGRGDVQLSWRPAESGGEDGAEQQGGWIRAHRVVGATRLTVEVPTADAALAEQILATAVELP
ncbi:MAG: hypothetical protein Q4F65_02225 [Propionibacteriaceae bacterium]|nr:hypothetical protein [Propionibacteriaceae bacterium]